MFKGVKRLNMREESTNWLRLGIKANLTVLQTVLGFKHLQQLFLSYKVLQYTCTFQNQLANIDLNMFLDKQMRPKPG